MNFLAGSLSKRGGGNHNGRQLGAVLWENREALLEKFHWDSEADLSQINSRKVGTPKIRPPGGGSRHQLLADRREYASAARRSTRLCASCSPIDEATEHQLLAGGLVFP